jgi:hypothetical protein
VIEKVSAKKKFPRAKSLIYESVVEDGILKQKCAKEKFSESKKVQIPETPIPVM